MSDTPGPSPSASDILATPMSELAAPHPLADADPNSVTLLFLADPSVLPVDNLDRLIAELRARADIHVAEEAAKAAKPKATRTKPTAPKSIIDAALRDKPISAVSIEDLLK